MNGRDQSASEPARSASEPPDDDESPGVPGFRSWRAVYVFVFAAFVAMVIALTLFARRFG